MPHASTLRRYSASFIHRGHRQIKRIVRKRFHPIRQARYCRVNLLCYNSTGKSLGRCRCDSHGGGKTIKLKYLCPRCEFNWRSCHNPKRPNVTRDEGCKDFWPRGKEKPPDTGKLSTAWVDGVDLSGLKKGKRTRHEK